MSLALTKGRLLRAERSARLRDTDRRLGVQPHSGFFIVTACTDHPVMCRALGLVSSRLASLLGQLARDSRLLRRCSAWATGCSAWATVCTSGWWPLVALSRSRPTRGRPGRHGDRAAPVLILPLATAVVAADAFAGELRWQVGSCGDAEFAVGVTQVGFDGGLGDEQVLGDLPVG